MPIYPVLFQRIQAVSLKSKLIDLKYGSMSPAAPNFKEFEPFVVMLLDDEVWLFWQWVM